MSGTLTRHPGGPYRDVITNHSGRNEATAGTAAAVAAVTVDDVADAAVVGISTNSVVWVWVGEGGLP